MTLGTVQQTHYLVSRDVISIFVDALRSSNDKQAAYALSALGNIVSDSADFMPLVLHENVIVSLIDLIGTNHDDVIARCAALFLFHLCKHSVLCSQIVCKQIVSALCILLETQSHLEVVINVIWALWHLLKEEKNLSLITTPGILPALVKYLGCKNLETIIPCIRIFGVAVATHDRYVDVLLQNKVFLPLMFELLAFDEEIVQQETCWVLSNIATESPRHIEAIMGVPSYVNSLLELAHVPSVQLQREAIWVLANTTKNATEKQVARLMHNGVMDCFVNALVIQDECIVILALEAIGNILNIGKNLVDDRCQKTLFGLICQCTDISAWMRK